MAKIQSARRFYLCSLVILVAVAVVSFNGAHPCAHFTQCHPLLYLNEVPVRIRAAEGTRGGRAVSNRLIRQSNSAKWMEGTTIVCFNANPRFIVLSRV